MGPSRRRSVSKARRDFYLRAREDEGITQASLARMTGLSHVSVGQAIEVAKQEKAAGNGSLWAQ